MDDPTYTERANSCEWNPEERAKWHAIGLETSKTLYLDATPDQLAYGIAHYAKAGATTYGSYEQGIHDGLTARQSN